jgi:hypothetical protein
LLAVATNGPVGEKVKKSKMKDWLASVENIMDTDFRAEGTTV